MCDKPNCNHNHEHHEEEHKEEEKIDLPLVPSLANMKVEENKSISKAKEKVSIEEFDRRVQTRFGDTWKRASELDPTIPLSYQKVIMFCSVCYSYNKKSCATIMSGQSNGCHTCCKEKMIEDKNMTNEEFDRRLYELHGDKYKRIREIFKVITENKSKRYAELFCELCKNTWNESIGDILFWERGCPNCKKTIEIDQRLHSIFGDTYVRTTDFDLDIAVYKQNVVMFCSGCYTYQEKLSQNVLAGAGCWECGIKSMAEGNKLTLDEWIQRARKTHGDKYNYSLMKEEDAASHTIVPIICPEHDVFWQNNTMHVFAHGCPLCNETYGERSIRLFLEKYNIIYEYNKTFPDCKYKNLLRFDFYIHNKNTLIEFDGKQHFEPSIIRDGQQIPILTEEDRIEAEENLRINQIRDGIKNQYCIDKGIKLIRIPYTDIDRIEEILERELF